MEGKLNAALKFLDEDGGKGVLRLSESVIKELKEKHPDPARISKEALLNGPIDYIPKCRFDAIDEQTVLKAALLTKGSAGPSGMDAEIYRRMLCSKNFSSVNKIPKNFPLLCRQFFQFITLKQTIFFSQLQLAKFFYEKR